MRFVTFCNGAAAQTAAGCNNGFSGAEALPRHECRRAKVEPCCLSSVPSRGAGSRPSPPPLALQRRLWFVQFVTGEVFPDAVSGLSLGRTAELSRLVSRGWGGCCERQASPEPALIPWGTRRGQAGSVPTPLWPGGWGLWGAQDTLASGQNTWWLLFLRLTFFF